ncbi:MAG: DsbE family thiol:disulfide interchange protein [Alphaproteobacteria bacterium]
MTEAARGQAEEAPAPIRRNLLVFVPLIVFLGLTVLFFVGLSGNPQRIPSALIGKPAPTFTLPALDGIDKPGLSTADFKGAVTVVNVFASWCIPCHEEHPVLMEMAKDTRFQLVGINNKDQADNARRFLGRNGNPYGRVGVDSAGRASIDWGVYGVPETFIVGRDGTIAYKHIGPITPQNLASRVMPEIEKALAAR